MPSHVTEGAADEAEFAVAAEVCADAPFEPAPEGYPQG